MKSHNLKKRSVSFADNCHTVFSHSKQSKVSKKQKTCVELAILQDDELRQNIVTVLGEGGKRVTRLQIQNFVRDIIIPNWEKSGILRNVVNEARQLDASESRPGF